MSGQAPVIALDGPSGSGKGTLASKLSNALGWHLLDSGALYRLLAFSAKKHNTLLDDVTALQLLALELDVSFVSAGPKRAQRVLLESEDVTALIRTEQAGADASVVAAIPEVRAALLQRQRDFQKSPGLIADGRDMGTIVFPDAPLKVFLTASAEERAKRRHLQLKRLGVDVNLSDLIGEIEARDARDTQRAIAPLKPAEDAIELDSTSLGIEQVFDRVMQEVQLRKLM